MSEFSQGRRYTRRARKLRNRKGLQLQRAEGLYDIEGLSQTISNSPGDKKANLISQNIQKKLTMGSPDDAYEKEADRTADKIVDASETETAGQKVQKQEEEEAQAKPLLQKQEEEEEEAQAKPLLQKQEEEEEEAQAKPLLQKQEEEEEEAQAKPLLQKQEEEEEEAQAKPLLQKQEEEEEAQAKPLLQKQEEEEEEAQAKPLLQKQEEEEEEAQAKPLLQRKQSSQNNTVAESTTTRLSSRKGMGHSLPGKTKNFMESHFKKDFSGVRIHTDNEANNISQKLNAQAFTLGKHIYFNAGKFNPESKQGKHLLAHELTHVVQQNRSLNKKEINQTIQRKCKPAPKTVSPKVKFKLRAIIKNNSGISGWGSTHSNKVKVVGNRMRFYERRICGICGPKNQTKSYVIYPKAAKLKATIPVSINKTKINKLGAKGERYYIDKKDVRHTGFYTAADAKKLMKVPVIITYGMTKRHELFHVAHIEGLIMTNLKSRHSDIGQFCPYKVVDGKTWKKLMKSKWSGAVVLVATNATNTLAHELAARRHAF
ncbi:DUF4157 domain-containing protein [Aliikangiella coralliicola]|uniref:DUF4157 domain-containing protein n=1 Tax=Aliikangiella coralliicola TaxID=2592383 RepID=A0A545UD87_9GAMM|nr:DUF4157 domain-containing protein [Aliikangiella coralliicola]TQV87426.1 DUF4157 domain-containing protein [Aliikangiella coralliicola]